MQAHCRLAESRDTMNDNQPMSAAAAAAGAVEEDVNTLITSVRSMGRIVANGAGMSLVA